ncbi:MAG: efflux RND transporter periplasmic adaptor subunit [Armatimonadota bacterium]|jgi:RND family efflux transporter MFP subunit
MNRAIVAVGAVVVAVVAIVAVLAVRRGGEQPGDAREPAGAAAAATAPRALQVDAEAATLETAERGLEVTGTVEARLGQDVSPELGGRVTRVFVDEGDFVRRGTTVVQLDDDVYQAQLRQAQAALKAARAQLRQAEHGTTLTDEQTRATIAQARAQVDGAQAQLEKARTATTLKDETSASQVQAAQAGLEAAEAQLREVRRGAREQEKRRAEATVDQARAVVDQMERGVQQRRRLVEAGALSMEQFTTYLTEFKVRKAQYESAKQALDLIEEGATADQIAAAEAQVRAARETVNQAVSGRAETDMRQHDIEAAQAQVEQARELLAIAFANARQVQVREEDVEAADAAVQQAQAQIDLIRLQIDKTRIAAPLSGIVSARNVEPGDLVGPTVGGVSAAAGALGGLGGGGGGGLLRIVDIASVDIEAKVSEKLITDVKVGQAARISVDALPGKTFSGTVSEVDIESLPGQRSFHVTVRVANPQSLLRPGMFARVTLVLETIEHAVMVPTDALVDKDGRTVVYVLGEDGLVRERAVETGMAKEAKTQVIGDVRPGDSVAVAGHDRLRDGAAVRVDGRSSDVDTQ